MLYLTVAVLLLGNCAIGTTANGFKVKFIPNGVDASTVAEVDMDNAVSVIPIAYRKSVGYVMYYQVMKNNFPAFNVLKPLLGQGIFTGTLEGKPLKNFTVIERVWMRQTTGSRELAKKSVTIGSNTTIVYHQDLNSDKPLNDSFYYFQAE